MRMTNETREKLETYLINADPFLWNTMEKRNKKERIQELQAMGFLKGYSVGTNATYTKINQDLLVELGLEGILEQIVIPRVNDLFQPETLRYFRRCWKQGQTPTLDYLKQHKLYRKHIFTNNETMMTVGEYSCSRLQRTGIYLLFRSILNIILWNAGRYLPDYGLKK